MGINDWANAIASIESAGSGGYSALGPITQRGNRAYGKYQVMDFNIGPWTEKYLGKRLTPQEFLASPEAQDAVFRGEFGSYVQKYGNPQDAASAWFTGQPRSSGANRKDILGTTGSGYVEKFNRALGQGVAADTMAALGKGGGAVTPDQIAQSAQAQSTGMQEEQQPRGLLGGLFGNPDLMANLAIAFNSMRLNPDPNLPQVLSAQMKQRRDERKSASQVNKTADWLESQGLGNIAEGVRSGAVPVGAAINMYQSSVKAAKDPNVQSSTLLPDQSGTILTMRDGNIRVITIGGETLEGQAAVDFVRQSQERNVQYQSDINRARSAGQFLGRTEAAEVAAAPSTISTADTTLKYIDAVRSHPGLEQGTGFSSTFNVVPGTPGYDFQNRVKQISSGAFLTAIQDLRGMGALSNSEGQTATAAVNRMDTATSKEEFLSALDDYQAIVEKGRQNALAKVSGQTQDGQAQQAAPAAPSVTQPKRIRYDDKGNMLND